MRDDVYLHVSSHLQPRKLFASAHLFADGGHGRESEYGKHVQVFYLILPPSYHAERFVVPDLVQPMRKL